MKRRNDRNHPTTATDGAPRLVLDRATIRALSTHDLRVVAGGLFYNTQFCSVGAHIGGC